MTSPLVSKISGLCLIFGTALIAEPAKAEHSGSDMLRIYGSANAQEKQTIEGLVRATENGMSWFSAAAKVKLYCPPEKLALTGGQIIDILRREVGEAPSIGGSPYGLAILLALKRTFPCP
ncbi:hypothetical protein [Bradyrhizobium sp. SBR1B]|uniref:hypothetical protein n=1 Tax=Bradyrhizobium sp. SBR1B TaxID=2663836 RepID=UPI0016059498|nr:hypothetical protein [Bradyrhizobium sp. SBR1B]MBB4375625.1 hypothetical protein [Bradyrhizobium sp. SBR1B]